MKISVPTEVDTVKVVKRAMFLAYEACGGALGMGRYQAREGATEDDVWTNVYNQADYPGPTRNEVSEESGKISADYVMGRMMKVGCRWDGQELEISDAKPKLAYQGWCHKYKTYEDLFKTALAQVENDLKNLGVKI